MKVLHVFYNFLPDLSGSSIRSAGLLSGQVARGMNVVAVSSPFQPGFGTDPVEEYNGVRVYRTYSSGSPLITEKGSSLGARLRKVATFPRFVRHIRTVANNEEVGVIHAHSTFYCALAAFLVARSLRLKFVYEFRSLWEERSKSMGLLYRLQARVSRWLESLSLRLADRVVAINAALKAEIVARGVPESRVDVVPNAVDAELVEIGDEFQPPERVRRFGYVGNFSSIEGLDTLVAAFRQAFACGEDVELLFHGSGSYESELRRIVGEANDPRIRICGAFAREEVGSVYKTLDCIVIPRIRSKLTDTVTPLKPLEAMAFKRLVGISDVQGLREVVGDSGNAWVFPPSDVNGLASGLYRIYNGEVDVHGIAVRGAEYVRRHRVWSAIAGSYTEIYAKC